MSLYLRIGKSEASPVLLVKLFSWASVSLPVLRNFVNEFVQQNFQGYIMNMGETTLGDQINFTTW